MKTIKRSLKLVVLATLITITNTTAQEFADVLETVYLTKTTQAEISKTSYDKLHAYLVEKETFSFNREIKIAKLNDETFLQNSIKYISKATYLKLLKKAANKSKSNTQFYRELTESVPQLKQVAPEETSLSNLYTTLRNNTTNGKLDNIGKSLTWL